MAFLRSEVDYVYGLCQIERRIEELPIQNKHIMGVTSLWYLIPIAYSLSPDSLSKRHYGTIALAVALLLLVVVSTLLFANAKEGSWLHRADRGLFMVCIALVIYLSLLPEEGRIIEHALLGVIALFCVVLYTLSMAFFKMAHYELQLWAHLNYRYVAYLGVHLVMVPTEASFAGYLVITAGYFAYVVLIYHVMDWSATSIQQELYWTSCVLLLCWICFIANIHAQVSYYSPA